MALSCCKIVCFVLQKTSKHDENFYFLNCLLSFSTKNKLKKHEDVCKNYNYCYIEMLKEESILKYNHGEKSIKVPFIIYVDMESLLYKI